jgi:alkanesulfonate monooxygenase SsuD/methylene tetrahydromethanopterin reductase-like flavin-dependent oxidoreductase (luciferase family)
MSAVPPRVALGLGYRDEELTTIGIRPADRVRTFVRHLDDLLSGEYAAELGAAQIWVGGNVDKMVTRAARRGLPIVIPGSNGPNGVKRVAGTYRDNLVTRSGSEPRIGIIKEIWVENDSRRLAEIKDRLRSMWRHYSTFWVDGGHPDRDLQREKVVEGISNKAIMGSTYEVVDKLSALVEAGADTLVCRIRFDSSDTALVTENMHRFAADVLPHLREG